MNRKQCLHVLSIFVLGCAGLFSEPVSASQVVGLARELGAVLKLVAGRILGPDAPAALAKFVADAESALWAIEHASASSSAVLPPDEARALFGRFLDAYESLWFALEAAGMLGPDGELLGPPRTLGELGSVPLDAGTVPSPEELRARIARRLGGES